MTFLKRNKVLKDLFKKQALNNVVTINDLREREYNGEQLTSKEHKALRTFDLYRIKVLNSQENEKDFQSMNGSVSSKKSKKMKIPGKKQMSYVGKKISRVLFDGKTGSRSTVGIAPHDDSSTLKSGKSSKAAKSPLKPWVSPSYVNYAEKYGKTSPKKSAARRQYVPQHARE